MVRTCMRKRGNRGCQDDSEKKAATVVADVEKTQVRRRE